MYIRGIVCCVLIVFNGYLAYNGTIEEVGVCRFQRRRNWTCKSPGDCEASDGNEISQGLCRDGLVCCPPQKGKNFSPPSKSSFHCGKLLDLCKPPSPGWWTNPELPRARAIPLRELEKNGVFPAAPQEFPFMALIGYGDRQEKTYSCAGVLISQQYVLTSAHCAQKNIGMARWVRLGEVDYGSSDRPAGLQEFSVVDRIVHPWYRSDSPFHDLALLQLDRDAKSTNYVIPACLHTSPTVPHFAVKAAGWGIKGFGKQAENWLMKTDMFMANSSSCYPHIRGNLGDATIQANIRKTICATPVEDGIKVCEPDVIGPLIVQLGGRCVYTVLGVSSAGPRCDIPFPPRAFTRVSSYLEWIENIVWP